MILKCPSVCSLGLKEHPPPHTVTVGRNASAKRWLLARRLPASICCTGYLLPLTWSPRLTAGKNTVSALAVNVCTYHKTVFAIQLASKLTLFVHVICFSFPTNCFCPSAGGSIYCCFLCRLLPGRVLSTVSTDHRASEKTETARWPIQKVRIRPVFPFNPHPNCKEFTCCAGDSLN